MAQLTLKKIDSNSEVLMSHMDPKISTKIDPKINTLTLEMKANTHTNSNQNSKTRIRVPISILQQRRAKGKPLLEANLEVDKKKLELLQALSKALHANLDDPNVTTKVIDVLKKFGGQEFDLNQLLSNEPEGKSGNDPTNPETKRAKEILEKGTFLGASVGTGLPALLEVISAASAVPGMGVKSTAMSMGMKSAIAGATKSIITTGAMKAAIAGAAAFFSSPLGIGLLVIGGAVLLVTLGYFGYKKYKKWKQKKQQEQEQQKQKQQEQEQQKQKQKQKQEQKEQQHKQKHKQQEKEEQEQEHHHHHNQQQQKEQKDERNVNKVLIQQIDEVLIPALEEAIGFRDRILLGMAAENNTCLLCNENPMDVVFNCPSKHYLCCTICAGRWHNNSQTCPMCRAELPDEYILNYDLGNQSLQIESN